MIAISSKSGVRAGWFDGDTNSYHTEVINTTKRKPSGFYLEKSIIQRLQEVFITEWVYIHYEDDDCRQLFRCDFIKFIESKKKTKLDGEPVYYVPKKDMVCVDTIKV